MVSQSGRPRADTRGRLLAAAAAEFAARGFDGAKVDRIAHRARVNKAMLYYHFRSKADLYREILRATFAGVGAAVAEVHARGGSPERQIHGLVDAVVREAATRPHFPAIWLREMAEGGRHLDNETMAGVQQVLQSLGRILAEGRRAGRFGPAHPFVTHLCIVAPILFFAASGPLRERVARLLPHAPVLPPLDAVASHVAQATLAALAADAGNAAAIPERRVRR